MLTPTLTPVHIGLISIAVNIIAATLRAAIQLLAIVETTFDIPAAATSGIGSRRGRGAGCWVRLLATDAYEQAQQ
jgi:hypothetical protein